MPKRLLRASKLSDVYSSIVNLLTLTQAYRIADHSGQNVSQHSTALRIHVAGTSSMIVAIS